MGEWSGAVQTAKRPPAKSTSDPRAAKTRRDIFSAIEKLMSDGSTTVSVSDIVRIAGISRSSFYAHYSGLDEVATEFLRAQFAGIGETGIEERAGSGLVGMSAARVGYGRLVDHMVEHYPLYSSVLELPLTRNAYDKILNAYVRRLLESILILDSVPAGVKPELVVAYVAGGALTLISAWIRGRLDVSDDELVEQLVRLLPPWTVEARS